MHHNHKNLFRLPYLWQALLRTLTLLAAVGVAAPARAQVKPTDVLVIRDSWGVPHIYGKTDPDVAYGLAWANAEDDFRTMQEGLLAARGRLGEVWGKTGAMVDYVSHLLRCRQLATNRYATDLSPEYRALLEAHVQGTNDYAAAHPDEVIAKDLFPVNAIDLAAAFQLQLALIAGITEPLEGLLDGQMPHNLHEGLGSNAFAFNSNATTDGGVYLNVNSHQPLEGLLSWYECHLVSDQGWNMYGGTFPGGMCIFHGANQDRGWAHTINEPDIIDVFKLTLNPKNKNQYRYNGQWIDLERDQVKLRVKVGPVKVAVKKEVLWTLYGPAMRNSKGEVYALRYAGLFDLRAGEQWYQMNKAQNFSQFKQALQMQALPRLNVVYADRFDTIYYLSNAQIPYRNPCYSWQGSVPGDTSATLWPLSYWPLRALPQTLNPTCGYVFNTNNSEFCASGPGCRVDANQYPESLWGFGRSNNNRAERFLHIVNQHNGRLNYEQFKALKFDQNIAPNSRFMQSLRPIFDLDPQQHPDLAPLLHELRTWDYRVQANSRGGATIFSLCVLFLFKEQHKEIGAIRSFLYGFKVDEAKAVEVLTKAKKHIDKHFHGNYQMDLGDILRHSRGTVNLPAGGYVDALGSLTGLDFSKNGTVRCIAGDSFILLTRFGETAADTKLQALQAYGQSAKPNSPHYTDQMQMFLNQELRDVVLDKAQLLKTAERVYHPGGPNLPLGNTQQGNISTEH